jgi:hypothetical protein
MSFLERQVIRNKNVVSNYEQMFMSHNLVFGTLLIPDQQLCKCMDEGTLKTPFFVWGGVAILYVLNLVKNRVFNSCRIWSTTQLNTPPPPPTATHCICTFTLGRGGGGQREGSGATVHKRGRKYQHG